MIENLDARTFLAGIEDESVTLVFSDPPFGTGDLQSQRGTSYRDGGPDEVLKLLSDIAPHIERILAPDGTVAILLDYRVVHEMHAILKSTGLKFEGEIIWTFGLGGTSKSWWSNKHNTILLFSKGNPKFHHDQLPQVPRKAKVGTGKYATDTKPANSVWDYTFPQTHVERVGYANQKPLRVVEPFILVHTDPGDLCVDPFGGSGTLMAAAVRNGRRFRTNDVNPQAVEVMRKRYAKERFYDVP